MRSFELLVCAALISLVGCRKAPSPRPPIVTVRISVVPADGGSAEFEVQRDGTVRGGHLSGDSVPFVHQDEGHLAEAIIDSLWTLLAAIDSQTATASPPAGRGYAALQLTLATNAAWVTSWPDSAQPRDPQVRAVVTWLMAHRIGGW